MRARDARIRFCNRALERLLGHPAEALEDRDWFEICVPGDCREPGRSAFRARIEG